MERIRRIVSVLLMALIGCVTVFQCHHHDASGHAFFLAYGDEEVALAGGHGGCHDHDCAGEHDDGASGCGMHLTDATTIAKAESHAGDIGLLYCLPLYCFFDFSATEDSQGKEPAERNKIGLVTAGYSHVNQLRGPPCV